MGSEGGNPTRQISSSAAAVRPQIRAFVAEDWPRQLGINVNVSATVAMIGGIAKSAKSYASGIRAYGSFCTLLGRDCHFPVTEELAMGFHFFFSNAGTYVQYLKHLRFAHHLLRLEVHWYTRSVKQVEKGVSKIRLLPKPRPSLLAGDVKQLMRAA